MDGPASIRLSVASRCDVWTCVTLIGRGAAASLLLGSVSQKLSHHAPCPLVIVPTPDE